MTEKLATTIKQQIKLLRDRGMTISDEDKAKKILMDKGYYRLGFYWFPFETTYPDKSKRSHKFKKDTKFEDAVALYYFDSNLRTIVAEYLYRIEINFRTNLIYNVSNYYHDDPFWFSNPSLVKDQFIKKLDDNYRNIMKNDAIKIHHKQHKEDKYAPAWKSLEYMTFGEIITLYKSLTNEELRHKIATRYNIRNLEIMDCLLTNIRVLRNLCAHSHNIFDLHLKKSIRKGPINNMNGHNDDLVGCLLSIHYIISSISKDRAIDLKKRIKDLVEDEPNEHIHCIIDYIKEFYQEPKLPE